jgi:hypothetical protein
MTHTWFESYKAAILETDWTRMQERLRTAELEIHERQCVLSLDHGGTPEEAQAIANALRGITHLKAEAGDWQKQQAPQGNTLSNRL